MKKTFKFLSYALVVLAMITLVGCSIVKFELKTEGNVTTIEQGKSVQLLVKGSNTATYAVEEGEATVNTDGLLTCLDTAPIDSKIVVSATSDLGTAKLTLKVVQASATSIKLSADSKTIKKGQTVNLVVDFLPTNAKEEDVSYEVVKGDSFAEVKDGKLTIKEDAKQEDILGEVITIKATTNTTSLSDELEIEVVAASVEEIVLTSDSETLVFGSTLKFNVSYVPEFAGVNADYVLSVVEGNEFVEIIDNELCFKEDVKEEEINGKVVIVKVTLEGNENVFDELEVTLTEREKINIIASDKTIIAGENASELIIPEAYDKDFNLLDLSVNDFTYESTNEDVVKVGLNDGKLTPVGHGHAQITISYENSSTTCDVYVIVVPEAIELSGLNTHILKTRKYYYSMNETLEFAIEFTNNPVYKNTCNELVYKFELLDENNEVVETSDPIATVSENAITFNVEGNIRVTITTNSSLNDKNTEKYEKSTSIVVSVNDGVNIRTHEDLIKYSNDIYNGKAANFVNDIILTETANFGIDDAKRYEGLNLFGDRFLYGNGYQVNLLDLPLSDSQTRANSLFNFGIHGRENTHTVEIYDLELVGNYDLNRQYIGNNETDKGKDAYNGSFHRGITISANYAEQYGVCKDLIISNVKVSNFNVGLRISHAVDAYVSDISISQCTTNGIELNQNIITLNNIYVGQVGAFAIEMVPDDIVKEADGTLHGTAGLKFNETPDTKLTGSVSSVNFNNGKSTAYMASLKLGEYTIPQILMMIVAGKIEYVSKIAASQTGLSVEECQMYFANLAYQCLFKDADAGQGLMNFFLLVFVDPTSDKFMGYNKGNKEDLFGTYSSDEVDGNVITIDKILTDALNTLLSGGSYDAYKNYKYVLLDLDLTSSLGFNLGEVLVVNEAYNK